MFQELQSLAKQLRFIGLSSKADDVSLIIQSIAGDKESDKNIELAIIELLKSGKKEKIQDELADLLMLHGDYTEFINTNSVEIVGKNFYIKSSNGSRITKLAASPEEAVALYLLCSK